MKKILLFALALFSVSAFSQTIPNNDFENWTTHLDPGATGLMMDSLQSGAWESGNPLILTMPALGNGMPKGFMYDTTFAQSGSHAVAMRTGFLQGLTATGNLFTGIIDNSTQGINEVVTQSNPLAPTTTGMPFTDQPSTFGGYFFFEPAMDYVFVNTTSGPPAIDTLIGAGDSCRINCILHKWNSAENKRDTVGYADFSYSQLTPGFMPFSMDIDYRNSDAPDSCSLIFLSSYDGTSFAGSPGSLLIIDSIYFQGSSLGIDENTQIEFGSIYSYEKSVIVDSKIANANAEVVDMNGRIVNTIEIEKGRNEFKIEKTGIYIIRLLNSNNKFLRSEKVVINQ